MPTSIYPTLHLQEMQTSSGSDFLLNIDQLSTYIEKNPNVWTLHRHNFYHIVFFTKGKGSHLIDFNKYQVSPGSIYFMSPGQVHQWHFDKSAEGYVINFSSTLFDKIAIHAQFLSNFRFLNPNKSDQVFYLEKLLSDEIESYFKLLLQEHRQKAIHSELKIISVLIQLFIDLDRQFFSKSDSIIDNTSQKVIFEQFELLVDKHFNTLKLPRDYAALLFISSHHLNAISKFCSSKTAGEIIRERIILEAKRMLINWKISISEIADKLNFKDNSYFVRFFKKYTGHTPESFRNKYFK